MAATNSANVNGSPVDTSVTTPYVYLPAVASNDAGENVGGTGITYDGTGADIDPRFVVGSGTESDCVTDNLTGLMWSKNANPWYEVNGSDQVTSVNFNTTDPGGNFQNKIAFCTDTTIDNCGSGEEQAEQGIAAVNAFNNGAGLCGHTDWRLPTVMGDWVLALAPLKRKGIIH